jgi:hypothetical protein
MSHTHPILAATTLLLCAGALPAQTASGLLREGDLLTGAPAGHVVNSLNASNTNVNGGFVVGVNSSDGVTTLSHAWGSADGSAPTVLQTEGTYGPLVQTSFESFLGLANNGTVSYSASGTGGPVGSFDSVWLGATPVAVQGDPHPTLPGQWWVFASRPGVTGDGVPYFVGGISNSLGGSTQNRGLFYGLACTPLLLGGDVLPNLPEPLSPSNTVSFDYRVSTLGTTYIAEVEMQGASVTSANDNAIVIGGSGLVLGGSLVQEGVLVPVSVGGDGLESWDNFDNAGIAESGAWFFTGDTDGAAATDEILVHNGLIRFREGDTIDGQIVTGAIEGAFMNESGAVAYVWDIDDGAGGSLEALFFEDTLLLVEGDEVDWDGDGNLDAGFVVTDLTGIAAVSVGADARVYFTVDVDINGGGVLEAFCFFDPGSLPFDGYCYGDGSGSTCPCGNFGGAGQGCANSTGLGAVISATGNASVVNDTLVLHAAQLPVNKPGIFFQGVTSQGDGLPFWDGLLCAGGNLKRLQTVFTNAGGNADTSVSISIAGAVNAGDMRHYQFWVRDTAGPCSTGANTTGGLSVQW